MTDYSPETVAATKRALAGDLTDADFKGWQHHPISALFFQYLADMIEQYRNTAADLVEGGVLSASDQHQLRNMHSLRGQITALREIAAIEISTIKTLYHPAEEQDQ